MKKALIFSALTLAMLLALCIADNAILSRRCDEWLDRLAEAETAMRDEDWQGAATALDALGQSWDVWQKYLHVIVDHEAISEAEKLLETCRQAVAVEEVELFWEHASPLRCQFRLLSELEAPNLENLL